jgi:hypothetical protein
MFVLIWNEIARISYKSMFYVTLTLLSNVIGRNFKLYPLLLLFMAWCLSSYTFVIECRMKPIICDVVVLKWENVFFYSGNGICKCTRLSVFISLIYGPWAYM